MADYIEREALLKALHYDPHRRDRVLKGSTFDIILNHPLADVEMVIYCDKCKHHNYCHAERIYQSEGIRRPYCCRGKEEFFDN